MKKLVLIALLAVFSVSAFAQKVAYVDSESILKRIPEYASVQKQLDALTRQWQKEVDTRLSEVERLYKEYQENQASMSASLRRKKEEEIVDREKAVKDFQRQKFGFEGDLQKERVKLIKPLQDRVSSAINAVAEAGQIDMVVDKNSQALILYINPRLDITTKVISKLGYRP